jgi:hypothetical protein
MDAGFDPGEKVKAELQVKIFALRFCQARLSESESICEQH